MNQIVFTLLALSIIVQTFKLSEVRDRLDALEASTPHQQGGKQIMNKDTVLAIIRHVLLSLDNPQLDRADIEKAIEDAAQTKFIGESDHA